MPCESKHRIYSFSYLVRARRVVHIEHHRYTEQGPDECHCTTFTCNFDIFSARHICSTNGAAICSDTIQYTCMVYIGYYNIYSNEAAYERCSEYSGLMFDDMVNTKRMFSKYVFFMQALFSTRPSVCLEALLYMYTDSSYSMTVDAESHIHVFNFKQYMHC